MSAQLNLYSGTEASNSVITKLASWRKLGIFQHQCFIFFLQLWQPFTRKFKQDFDIFHQNIGVAARPRPSEVRKTKKNLFAPVQTIFPELKMRAVVRGSLILMMTAANLYKYRRQPHSPAEGFSWSVFLFILSRTVTFKAQHSMLLLCKSIYLPAWSCFPLP